MTDKQNHFSVMKNKRYPSEEKQVEIVEFIESAISAGPETFENMFKDAAWIFWRMLTQFFMLPKTELHKEFREKILNPIVKRKEQAAEEKLVQKIKWLIERSKNDKVRDWDFNDFIVRRITACDWDRLAVISMQYTENDSRWRFKEKFANTHVISENKHPRLWKRFVEKGKK